MDQSGSDLALLSAGSQQCLSDFLVSLIICRVILAGYWRRGNKSSSFSEGIGCIFRWESGISNSERT